MSNGGTETWVTLQLAQSQVMPGGMSLPSLSDQHMGFDSMADDVKSFLDNMLNLMQAALDRKQILRGK